MKLLFKQRLFSWFDSYDIYDEQHRPIYTVKGKLSWGHKLEIYDSNNNHIATLTERVLTFLPRFEIYVGGSLMGEVVKEFSFLKPSFKIRCKGWQVNGDFWEWNYSITKNSSVIARIEKQLFNWTDTYVIDVVNDEDCLLALMVVLAIDAVKCSQNNG